MNTYLKNRFVQVVVISAAGITASFAAVDAGVTTALTTAGTDAAVVGAAMLIVIVGIRAFKLLRKAL